jgi:nitroreductase
MDPENSMPQVNAQTVLDQQHFRYAVKKFDDSLEITQDVWSVIEQSLVLSPSSYGLQPWKFYVVTDKAIKAKLPEISWTQTQPRECSHMVVLAARKDMDTAFVEKYIARIAEVRHNAPNEGLKKMILGSVSRMTPEQILQWNVNQVYIALGNLMTTAAMLGVDSCPMEGIVSEKYDELLGIDKEGYKTIVGCALGYRASDDPYAKLSKVRYETPEVIKTI